MIFVVLAAGYLLAGIAIVVTPVILLAIYWHVKHLRAEIRAMKP